MCSLAAASIAAVVGSALASGVQNDRNIVAQRNASRENAKRMGAAASDAQFRGTLEAGQVQQKYSQIEGAQKAGMASSGFSLDSGSYLDILAGTQNMKSYEEANAYANAAREALGYQREAADYRKQAEALDKDRIWNVASTLVGGASQVSGSWASKKGN